MCITCQPNQQSPVHIHDDVVYETDFPRSGNTRGLVLRSKSAEGKVKIKKDNFYHVSFTPGQGEIKLNRDTYYVAEFHFHEASEHWINQVQYAMELHIVFQGTSGRAVLGRLIEEDKSSDSSLVKQRSVEELLGAETADAHVLERAIETNPFKWLPRGAALTSYYRYEGSLTTPEFDEDVSWLVFKQPLPLGAGDIAVLRKHFGLPARVPQPLNRRYILAT